MARSSHRSRRHRADSPANPRCPRHGVIEQFRQDLFHGLRSLGRNRAFTAVFIVTLGLGIGSCTGIFPPESLSQLKRNALKSIPMRHTAVSVLPRNREQFFGNKRSQGFIVPIAEGSFALREQFSRALILLLWGLAALLDTRCDWGGLRAWDCLLLRAALYKAAACRANASTGLASARCYDRFDHRRIGSGG